MLWLLLLLPLQALGAAEKTLGVPPDSISKYVPSKSNTWTCLDGSKEIPWDYVNDDACDCADGSDEPGTGACPNQPFYCKNEGHVGSFIPSSRVKDGLCEPNCCDGSDERPGVCNNVCQEVGQVYRKKVEEENKIRKTGSKIRSTYIAYAHKEKKRLEGVIETSAAEIAIQEKEVVRLRDIAERSESLSAAALELKQQSPLYISLITHSNALKSLQREHKKYLQREKELSNILDALRTGYNPNYQDMAVLEAVRGWEEIAGLPHINDVGKDSVTEEEAGIQEDTASEVAETKEEVDDEMWSAEELEKDLDDLLNSDYVTLLLEHDEYVQSVPEGSVLFDIASYLPDSIAPQYEEFKDTLISWLVNLGVIKGETPSSTDTSRSRQALTDAENRLNSIKKEKEDAENDLKEIFNIHGYGLEGQWKKLDGTCLRTEVGDYTYEVCLFGEAKQIPNKGGSTFSLGKFSSWNPSPDVKPGDDTYYGKQIYNRGTRCWNGPERNVVLLLSCGTENTLNSVVELEKCEYQFTGTTPALCRPLDSSEGKNGQNANAGKDEL
ncbi:glucosidase II beta subunit-like-domain-containing protein [Lentinula aff. detonsa]|uniref:Glucosidase 2 subunit beta n=1 Tax=Lentinula aff. detonsa TaxID=2804958 RepID=A0AA38NT17_9AGAR|nr:glucosidase II beta subunit-like-domain-containing protein [Lentinula aff. detonsa]